MSIFHQRYDKMIKQVMEKEKEAAQSKSSNQTNTILNMMLDESHMLLDRAGGDGFAEMLPKVADDFGADPDFNAFTSYVDGVNANGGA